MGWEKSVGFKIEPNLRAVMFVDPTGHMLDDGCRYEGCDKNREKQNYISNPVIEKLKANKERANNDKQCGLGIFAMVRETVIV